MRTDSLKSHLLALSSLLSIPLLGLIYVYLNHAGGAVNSLVTDLDRQVPFLKGFVLPYIAWYPFLFIAFVYLAFRNRELFYHTLLHFNLGLLFVTVYTRCIKRMCHGPNSLETTRC